MPDRDHDVSSLTADQLQRVRRDLQVSLALAFPGSPVREPILAQMIAIDAELEHRADWDYNPVPRTPPAAAGLRSRGSLAVPSGQPDPAQVMRET
jgi:hypothetical protein